jgi:UDP-N-acetylmuramoyl-L-alanyl-D-glutamate--2,6-diaminopimelate ligase
VSVKAARVAEHSEGAAQKKLLGAARGPMRLVKLLRGVEASGATSHGDLEIAEIAYDSRKVNPGTLFVAVRGERTDGNKFVGDAIARGAVAIVSEDARPESIPAEISWIKVPAAR